MFELFTICILKSGIPAAPVKITKVQCPLLIMHGEDDFLISLNEAELNYNQEGSQVKYLEILAGVGHNDMLMAPENRYFTTLLEFIRALAKNE